uniref:keratin, type I cytoskeletal 18-like isoform X1 n=1 Tax=Gasterosteus aculeatus aculeatus TaxID=481459 RepID=UPI001A99C76E|nr:keratin, type I cytoskeletal 18-like isoform X1 [Gasterosteus aculeatus aculeatus]
MPSNTAASMFGGAGGRGSRASVATLEGLRNVLRSEPERNAGPVAPAARVEADHAPAPASAAAPAAPVDDKHTMQRLNDRLSGYLGRVGQLERENEELAKEIDDILANRKAADGRNWDEVEKPLNDLKKEMKDIAKDNGKLLLQIENSKLANADFKKKLNDEITAKKELEKEIAALKDTIEDTKVNHAQIQKEIDLLKEELTRLENEHKDDVEVLLKKIKNSEVKVEIESSGSDLSEIVNKIRIQYEKISEKNMKENNDWYQSKFENLKVVVDKNDGDWNSAKSELKELLTQKRSVELKIQGIQSKINQLEEALSKTREENNQRLSPLNQVILRLEAELRDVRAQLERHMKNNIHLLGVKMQLEDEMNKYHRLMHDITAEPESVELSLEDALQSEHQVPNQKKEEAKEAAPVKE